MPHIKIIVMAAIGRLAARRAYPLDIEEGPVADTEVRAWIEQDDKQLRRCSPRAWITFPDSSDGAPPSTGPSQAIAVGRLGRRYPQGYGSVVDIVCTLHGRPVGVACAMCSSNSSNSSSSIRGKHSNY